MAVCLRGTLDIRANCDWVRVPTGESSPEDVTFQEEGVQSPAKTMKNRRVLG